MSDTVKLVVTISKDQHEICKQALKGAGGRLITECEFAIAVGTPLDDATNKDVLNIIFPDAFNLDAAERWTGGEEYITSDWLNAPYKAESEEE